MKQAFQDVSEFHRLGGLPCGGEEPTVPAILQTAFDAEHVLLAEIAAYLKDRSEGLKGSSSAAALRVRLMVEELGEVIEAIVEQDTVKYADGLADLCYVTIGSAVQCSIPLPEVWAEVQRANVSKFPLCPECSGDGFMENTYGQDYACGTCGGHKRIAIRDAGGKVQKPPGWQPPDIASVLVARGGLDG